MPGVPVPDTHRLNPATLLNFIQPCFKARFGNLVVVLKPAPPADNGVIDDFSPRGVPTVFDVLDRIGSLRDVNKTAKRFRYTFFGEVLKASIVPAEEFLRIAPVNRHYEFRKQMMERL